ncbi:MAG: 3-dehydroquinate synthase [Endomicrobiaceae bacterium]|nr:3-dehydroquinate synthase [Endomicrobiaceae bacterium]MDD5101768.1 3-dehydroquinate synthase [Endomicrobiaceae bacterium]
MRLIKLKLKLNSYPIIFSDNNEDLITYFKKYLSNRKIFFISDTNVSKFYLKQLQKLCLQEKFNVYSYVFKAGEGQKTIDTLNKLYNYALSVGIDRQFAVVALGGGVVGDTAGFFASTYMRGLKLVQVPTSLLAMVDSSIGGKTGVNIEKGKNIVGAFYQPQFVFVNTQFLKTLDPKHLKNGMAEIIKYAISFDQKFFNKLNLIFQKSIITEKDFKDIIYQCCKFKADIVQRDEKEVTGIRELLNFGHTFAHALETITKYKQFLHGEAVAIGILFVAILAEKIKFCDLATKQKIEEILINAGFNEKISKKLNHNTLLNLMKKDKKSVSQIIKFVLPRKIGQICSRIEVNDQIILKAIEEISK